MQTDMTVGKPMKMILDFTIPVFIGNVFQQFYNMADAIIVGKFVGTKGLAAVGSTGTIMFLIIGFLMGLTAGFTVLTSQKFGAGKMDEMRQSVGNAALLSIIISVIMTAVSMVGMHSLLTLMHTPEDIFQDAYTYIMIICGGIFAQVLYNILASILRALGNSKTPLYFLILAALLNIVLDLTFIIVFHMGVAGAAWATITAQGVSGVLCLIYIIKCVPELKLKADDWRFRSDNAQNIGARKLDRVRQGFNSAHIIGITYAIVTGVIIFFFGKYLSYLFISDNAAEVIPMVDTYVKCVAVFFIPLHFVNALRNGIQGMGYGLLPMLAGVAELAGRGITAMVAAAHKSYFGACMASPMAWVLAGGLLIVMYFYVMKDKKVNSRCKLEELCYNETCSAGLCDQYINSVYCEAYY